MFLCAGIVAKEASQVLAHVHANGFTIQVLRVLLNASWKLPLFRSNAGSVSDLITDAREKHFNKKKELTLTASECMDIAASLRFFLEYTPGLRARFPQHVTSFCHLADAVHLIKIGKHAWDVSQELERKLQQHAAAYAAAYGAAGDAYIPKLHYCRHTPAPVNMDKFLMDTFVTERKHAMIKEATQHVDNTRVFERSVLGRALVMHEKMNTLRKYGLIGKTFVEDGIEFSVFCQFRGNLIGDGDIICLPGTGALLICGFAKREQELGILAWPLSRGAQLTSAAWSWRKDEDWRLFVLEASARFRFAALWSEEAEGEFIIVER